MGIIRGVIFDFDGTLTELTLDFQDMRAEIEKIARRYVPGDVITALESHYIIEMIYEIEDSLHEGGLEFRKEAFLRLRDLELEASGGKDVYPYTRDVLSRLRREGIKVGVITRSCLDVLRGVFPDIDEYVEAIVTREHVREVKPHPRHVSAMAELLSILPEEGLMVGDHPTDVAAGRAAGMETAGLLSGRTGKEDFEKAEATYILEDIRGIPGLLGGRKRAGR